MTRNPTHLTKFGLFFKLYFLLLQFLFCFGLWYFDLIILSFLLLYILCAQNWPGSCVVSLPLSFISHLNKLHLFLAVRLHSITPKDELLYPARQWRKHGSHLWSIALPSVFLLSCGASIRENKGWVHIRTQQSVNPMSSQSHGSWELQMILA